MPKHPWRFYSPLRTHDFDDGIPLKGREPGRLFVCRNCLKGGSSMIPGHIGRGQLEKRKAFLLWKTR